MVEGDAVIVVRDGIPGNNVVAGIVEVDADIVVADFVPEDSVVAGTDKGDADGDKKRPGVDVISVVRAVVVRYFVVV